MSNKKLALLLHTIGEDAFVIYETFNLTENQNKADLILQKFEEYLHQKSEIVYRHIFNREKKWKANPLMNL